MYVFFLRKHGKNNKYSIHCHLIGNFTTHTDNNLD